MKKKKIYELPSNTLYTNYKAEVFASGMIQEGIRKNKIRIIRKGRAKRNVAKEVDRLACDFSSQEEIYTIYTNKRDLYDSLPKGVFHEAGSSSKAQQKSAVLKSIEKGKKEEFNARYFFKPFEMFLDEVLINLQLYERQLERPHSHPDFINLFVNNWKFIKDIPLDKALFLLNFLSQSNRITRGEQIAQILGSFLGCDVSIQNDVEPVSFQIPHKWILGKGELGKNSFIGNTFIDTLPIVNLKIANLRQEYKELVYSGSAARKQLHILLDLFIPADAQLRIHIEGYKEETLFKLTSNAEKSAILGFSTRLEY